MTYIQEVDSIDIQHQIHALDDINMSAKSSSDTINTIDVAPTSIRSPLGWMCGLFAKPSNRFVGIDFGGASVRVAALQPWTRSKESTKSRPALRWNNGHQISLRTNAQEVLTPDRIDRLIDSMCDALPRCVDGEKNVAAVAIPASWVHYETTTVDPSSDIATSLDDEIRQRCDQMFLSSAFRSVAHLSHWPASQGGALRMVAATASDTACRIAEGVNQAGYQVQCILPRGVALTLAANPLTSLSPGCIVHLQRVSGLVSVAHQGRCGLTRTLPNCPPELFQADDLDSLAPWIDQVAAEVQATLKFSARSHGGVEPDDLVTLCGDFAHVDGLDVAFANRLQRPVSTWMFVGEKSASVDADQSAVAHDARHAVALSLAYAASLSACHTRNSGAKK